MLQGERNSTVCREFRIVDDKRYLIGIAILSILTILVNVCSAFNSDFYIEDFLFTIAETIAALFLLVSILSVRKTYLSDYIIIFILTGISFIPKMSVAAIYMDFPIILIITVIITIILTGLFCQIIKGKIRKTWSVLVLSLILFEKVSVGIVVGTKRPYMHFWLLYIGGQILFFLSLLLFVLSISNNPSKAYASKALPTGKHIRTRSIGFSVIMSILTCGLYFYIVWTYCIISDIRKLEGKRGIAVGEWLLYDIVPIYDLVWLYTRANKLSVIGANNKIKSNGGGGFYVFMHIIFLDIVNMALMQSTLNDLAQVMDGDFVYGTVMQQNYMAVKEETATNVNYMEKLYELNELRKAGIISEEEFAEKKAQFLAKM
ncbi:MAG: DUF4234 domain-containing protein [Lachnospiraceae bacterium]|nr:DUF4234 domain-containing protein [Lachnospiraceae bacterium]